MSEANEGVDHSAAVARAAEDVISYQPMAFRELGEAVDDVTGILVPEEVQGLQRREVIIAVLGIAGCTAAAVIGQMFRSRES